MSKTHNQMMRGIDYRGRCKYTSWVKLTIKWWQVLTTGEDVNIPHNE